MTVAAATTTSRRFQDYVTLTKPRITLMVVLTAAVGFVAASGEHIDPLLFLHATLGTGVLAAGAATLNMLNEREVDARMRRTAGRPLPAGRMEPVVALRFGVALSLAGVLYLAWACNQLTAVLGAVTLASYVWVYTPLKQRTSLATLIGAVPGALPPVMGWAAGGGPLDARAGALFAILFLWQLPHFLAIAWLYREDYARGGFPLLTIGDEGGRRTGRQMVLYCATLLPISLLPSLFGMAGGGYAVAAAVAGLGFFAACAVFAWRPGVTSARRVLLVSVAYLPAVMLALMLDRTPPAADGSFRPNDGATLLVAPGP